MYVGQSRGFGFNPFSAVKSAASDVYHVAQDPRAQALIAAGGQAYAPGVTSKIMSTTHAVQDNIRRARAFMNPQGQVVMVAPGQAPPPGFAPQDDGGGGGGGELPVQNSHMLVYAAVGGGLLLLFLLMKR